MTVVCLGVGVGVGVGELGNRQDPLTQMFMRRWRPSAEANGGRACTCVCMRVGEWMGVRVCGAGNRGAQSLRLPRASGERIARTRVLKRPQGIRLYSGRGWKRMARAAGRYVQGKTRPDEVGCSA